MILDADREYIEMMLVVSAFVAFLAVQAALYWLINRLRRQDPKFDARFGKNFNPLGLSWNDQKQIIAMIRESAIQEHDLESRSIAKKVILLYRSTVVGLLVYVLTMLILIVTR